MLDSPELSVHDKKNYRLAQEMSTLVGAGTETTGNTLQAITFYLLKSPETAGKLRDEIQAAQSKAAPSKLRYADLQQLPYLVS